MVNKKTPRKSKASAAGQYYGFSIAQGARLLHRLLEAKVGESVAIEWFDDISVEGPDGTVVEQVKSGLTHNPISDHSKSLWKTFYNWLEAIRNGTIPSNATFVLYVTQNYTGNYSEKIHECRSEKDAGTLIDELRNEFADIVKQAHPQSQTKAFFIKSVLNADDRILSLIFKQFVLQKGSGEAYEDIKRTWLTKAVSEEAYQAVVESLIGWTQSRIAQLIEKGAPPLIKQAEFQSQLLVCVKTHDRNDTSLIHNHVDVDEMDIEEQILKATYVRQLKLLEIEKDHLINAARDYLKTSSDCTHWGVRGIVTPQKLNAFHDQLLRHWRNNKELCELDHDGKSEIVRGKYLYFKCSGISLKLDDKTVPDHFTPGTFHQLADEERLGWHPRYQLLLWKDEGT